MSATPESTIANPDQLIADLQRQLAEREAELAEAREQQIATAEVLQVINSSPGNLSPVFDTVCKTAARLCRAEAALISSREGEAYRVVATHSFLPDFVGRLFAGPGTMSGRVGLEGHIVHIPDIAADPEFVVTESVRAGLRTALGVPLLREATVVGTINLARLRVEPFTDREIELVRTFADQAVIAMENARLITETREALEQQTATAEVLQVINSSPGDLAPVFDAILEKAHSLCDVSNGSLQLYDSHYFHTVATRGMSQPLMDLLREPYSPDPDGLLQPVIAGARFVQIDDQAAELSKQTIAPNPRMRLAVELDGIRTALFVPLRRNEALLGMISCARHEVRPFTDKQIALLENFAAQAVIAMENARLLTETREALEQQTATAEVLQVINSSPGELSPVFGVMLEKSLRLCEADLGTFWTYDGDGFEAVALRGAPNQQSEFLRGRRHKPGPGTIHALLLAGEKLVHILDAKDTEAYRAGEPMRRQSVDVAGARTVLAVPLRKGDQLLGLVNIYRRVVRSFSDKQISLLENFAAQAVIAMENARLLGELRQRTDEVAELNRGLEARVAEQVEELGRVGRLKRFLAPQLAELIVSQGDEKILESHRREIVVVFCDLRGYTAFTETAEPEEVLDFLRGYHGALGPLVAQFEGTLDQFSGDGIMVFFNDPVPCPDPAERAVNMAMEMREEAGKLIATWRRDGCELGFGVGIAQGYATLGQIGFSERSGYTAIGTVCNLAARLCAEAKDGQILISSRVARAVEAIVNLENLGNLELKGLRRPVAAFNVVQGTNTAEVRPNLTVVPRGTGA
jgi:adenylate cyclase